MKNQELAHALADAARIAVSELFREYPAHRFYYCSLITTGEGHTPFLTAWSKEKLEEAVFDKGGDSELARELIWSYVDSPFFCFGEHHFNEVKQLLISRSDTGDRDSTNDLAEVDLRLDAMESAMAMLDAEGLFGTGVKRFGIFINAEVMPPDSTNVARARRLNPPEALEDWLDEAAESESLE